MKVYTEAVKTNPSHFLLRWITRFSALLDINNSFISPLCFWHCPGRNTLREDEYSSWQWKPLVVISCLKTSDRFLLNSFPSSKKAAVYGNFGFCLNPWKHLTSAQSVLICQPFSTQSQVLITSSIKNSIVLDHSVHPLSTLLTWKNLDTKLPPTFF